MNSLDVTRVEIKRISKQDRGVLLAVAAARLGTVITIHGFRVVNTRHGERVFPPQEWVPASQVRRNLVEFHEEDLWPKISEAVLAAYRREGAGDDALQRH